MPFIICQVRTELAHPREDVSAKSPFAPPVVAGPAAYETDFGELWQAEAIKPTRHRGHRLDDRQPPHGQWRSLPAKAG